MDKRVKIVSLMRRRDGMTRADFRAYYETVHVPLIVRHVPFWSDYRRNYASEARHVTGHRAAGRSDEQPFDVLTELTYADEEAYRRTLEVLADPRIGALIAADEERFLDRASMRSFVVEECVTPPASGPVRARITG